MLKTPRLLRTSLTLLLLSVASTVRAADASASIEARLAAMESQLQALQAELAQLRTERNPPLATTVAPAGEPSGDGAASASPAALSWSGYGELNYTRPAADPSQARADLGRFVLGVGYRFDEHTRLQAEVEIEHAVSSARDPGEVALEQAYIEHDLSAEVRARLGLFLIPSGLLNENHEPTRYYGVFRNFVETAIIPSTWREGGIALQGTHANGWRWDAGVTTSVDLSKWDAASVDGRESPLRSIHQELAQARAASLAGYLAANYTGVNGLRLGASLFAGGAGQGQPGFNGNRVSLWETHARWQPGAWDFAALYARGHMSNTAALNQALVGSLTLIPETFFGWYVEAAWRARVAHAWPVVPFVRYERFNTASSYALLAAAQTPQPLANREALTVGVQAQFAPGVIIKADYVDFAHTREGDRFDLGLGYEF